MGYRSDVTIVIQGTEEARDVFWARAKLEGAWCEDLFDYTTVTVRSPIHTVYEYKSFKWYDEYDQVEAWKRIRDLIERCGEDMGVGIEFMRLGEEDTDIENWLEGDAEITMYVDRSIGFY